MHNTMNTYRVINQRVEINGKVREIGEELPESAFGPAPDGTVYKARPKPEDMSASEYARLVTQEAEEVGDWVPQLTELESLLSTNHVEKIG